MKKIMILFGLLLCSCSKHLLTTEHDLSDHLVPMGSYDYGENGDHISVFHDNKHRVVCYVLDNKDAHSISCIKDLEIWNIPDSEIDENHQ